VWREGGKKRWGKSEMDRGGLPIRGKTKEEKQIIDQIEKGRQQHSDQLYDVFVAKLFPTKYIWKLELEYEFLPLAGASRFPTW
jgi:hypothetical protein